MATSWAGSPDGLSWTFNLREASFSDGTPFTAEDVLFSFRAIYDPKVESQIGSSILIDGKPMEARALNARTVVIKLPSAFAPGISLLESVPILPAHKLRAALEAGKFSEMWLLTTPPTEIVGLGPFVLESYKRGERMVFTKNPRFWKRDASGQSLPHLDRIEVQFTPSQDTEVLRLQAGAADLTTDRVRVEDLTSLRSLSQSGKIELHDAGVSISPDMLWFNLDPASPNAREHSWLLKDEFRHAVSKAVDRSAIVNTVYLGEAVAIGGPITPGHGEWYRADVAPPAFDASAAKTALDALGLVDRNGDGVRDDAAGKPVAFQLLTRKGNSVRERTAALIQEDLRRVGVKVEPVPLEGGGWQKQWAAGTYDSVLFSIEFDSIDPGRNLDFWLSSGPFHFWHPGQKAAATTWEGQIDSLMKTQSTTSDVAERKRLLIEAEKVLAAHDPVLYFAAPKFLVATSSRLGGVTASVLAPHILWNAEALFIKVADVER